MSAHDEAIDPIDALKALQLEDVRSITPVSGGWDTLIWRVETGNATLALRLFRPDQTEQCVGEARVMQLATELGLPAPRVLSHTLWNNRPAMLMEWCAGRPLLVEARENPSQIESLGRSMGRLQARLHSVAVSPEYGEDHKGWLSRVGPNEEELIARLRNAGLHDGHLLHLDYHPLNVLAADGKATAILDWSNGLLVGDPRADFARTSSILRLVSAPPGLDPSTFTALRNGLEAAWRTGYTEIAGPLRDMALFDIWATLYFIRDLEPRLNTPGFFMNETDFVRLRSHVAELKTRAGLT